MAKKKREEDQGGGGGGWINTFADLMNLLLCFFVLLFS
ncbi:MAG: chemotaxis protein, partial [Eubacterium sp.]|nr:chemotaxis protein [Eubacterium sp.]